MSDSRSRLRIERPDPLVVEILRAKSPRERFEMAFAANRLARERIAAHLRNAHPDWNDDQIRAEVARRMLCSGNRPMS